MKHRRIPSASDEAMMWVAVLSCCTVNLMLAADWVGLI